MEPLGRGMVSAKCFPAMKTPVLIVRCVALFAVVLSVSGCASYHRIAEYPSHNTPAAVGVTSKPMSKMSELPVGVFYDPDRQIIISGHQKGLGVGMMFGLVGVMIADQSNKSSAEKKYGGSAASTTADLGMLTRELLEAELNSADAVNWSLAENEGQLRLSPYAVFTVLKSGKARLYAMLRAEIIGATGEPTWSVRYFARAPGEYSIEGDDGWMIDDRFVSGMRVAMARTLRVCRDDTHGRLTGTKTITARGILPYMNVDNLDWRFIVVQESEDHLVARLCAGDVMVSAGTHVLDRADFTVTPATFKDPRK